MPTWDAAAAWYLRMVGDRSRGFNDLAGDVTLALLGGCEGRAILDVGCGEGHVARRLARAGGRVVGVEPTAALGEAAAAAEAAEPLGIRYRHDTAEELATVEDGSCDAVVATLVLHHVGNLPLALAQARRVLRTGGTFVAVVPHPWAEHPGATWDAAAGRPRRVVGDYLREAYWAEGDGRGPLVSVRQIGWHHRTVATWLTAVADAGLRIERVVEPPGAQSRRDDGGPWAAVPRFLALRASAT